MTLSHKWSSLSFFVVSLIDVKTRHSYPLQVEKHLPSSRARMGLTATQIVDYYSLYFQIEFDFRDAKQFWGLENFMNVSAQAVTNAVNLAFLMVNLSVVMLRDPQRRKNGFSVLDLKTHFRARRYLTETIKCLPILPDALLISRLWTKLSALAGMRTQILSQFSP